MQFDASGSELDHQGRFRQWTNSSLRVLLRRLLIDRHANSCDEAFAVGVRLCSRVGVMLRRTELAQSRLRSRCAIGALACAGCRADDYPHTASCWPANFVVGEFRRSENSRPDL